MGEGQRTQNIQINNVIGENKKKICLLQKKNVLFWLTQYDVIKAMDIRKLCIGMFAGQNITS